MGQYHQIVNLTKREFILPHKLGAGLKQWEQLANPGMGRALIILLAFPAQRGGGDFDVEENWHGPERTFPAHNTSAAPMPEDYAAVAARTIGRWYGDQIAMVGDYAEDEDVEKITNRDPSWPPFSAIYGLCREATDEPTEAEKTHAPFTDISDDVCRVIEHELGGRFVGNGWRNFIEQGGKVSRWRRTPEGGFDHSYREPEFGKVESIDPLKIRWEGGSKLKIYKDPRKVDFFA